MRPLDDTARSLLTDARALARVAPEVAKILPYVGRWSPARLVERNADATPDAPALFFGGARYSWDDVDRRANQYARYLAARGVGRGDVVALLMDNRPDFLFIETALSKLGAVAALLNTGATGKALVHAIKVARPRLVVVGSEHEDEVARVRGELDRAPVLVQSEDGARGIDADVAACSAARLASSHEFLASDPASYIYTSGTTGLPKAAVVTNQRYVGAAAIWARALMELAPGDVVYVALPLYHASAQWFGWGACSLAGATMALRRKFSASAFWRDVHSYDATHFLYIGEICRYLLSAPPQPDERSHRLKMGVGNGLRADVWTAFQERFAVPLMREFYGATEGNALLVNIEGRPGRIGRLRMGQRVLRCDPSTGEPIRDARGLCQSVAEGETGLFVAKMTRLLKFEGYVDAKATSKKVLTDVERRGDAYFNSGDLLTLHPDGWLSFADRVGDTFRWKGENVSTNEVAEALNLAPGVLESNVYGVELPGAEGRCGMASLCVDDRFDLAAFASYVKETLPSYKRPMFLRLQREMKVTGTFKHQKVEYRRDGYDPSKCADPLYWLDGERYVPIDAALHERLRSGRVG